MLEKQLDTIIKVLNHISNKLFQNSIPIVVKSKAELTKGKYQTRKKSTVDFWLVEITDTDIFIEFYNNERKSTVVKVMDTATKVFEKIFPNKKKSLAALKYREATLTKALNDAL